MKKARLSFKEKRKLKREKKNTKNEFTKSGYIFFYILITYLY